MIYLNKPNAGLILLTRQFFKDVRTISVRMSTVLHIQLNIIYLAFCCYLPLPLVNNHQFRAHGIVIPILQKALSESRTRIVWGINVKSYERFFGSAHI